MYDTSDTIAAIATAAGGAAQGILRVSGPDAIHVVERCFRAHPAMPLNSLRRPTAIRGVLTGLGDAWPDLQADLYVWPTARSYTRQPAVEVRLPGSAPLLAAALRMLCAAGARLAEPGEFTLRAFLAGRLDLTQADAVLGVIDARESRQLAAALEQLAGGVRQPLTQLRETLLDLLSRLEAGLDFVEEDIEFVSAAELQRELTAATSIVGSLATQLSHRSQHAEAVRVVLVGLPNVGKSSLFNTLCGSSRALVSRVPGTTRDYLTATIELEDVRCQLIDTAGFEADAMHIIARTAQRQTASQNDAAAIEVLCLDRSRALDDWEIKRLAQSSSAARIVAATKCDLPPVAYLPSEAIATSASSGVGINRLRATIRQAALNFEQAQSAWSLGSERSQESIRLAEECLARAAALNLAAGGEELIAAEIRLALDELGKVVGAVYTDEILDRIFSRFCIGK